MTTYAGSVLVRVGRLSRRNFEDRIAYARTHRLNVTAECISSGLLDATYRVEFVGSMAEAEWVDRLLAAW